MAAPLINVPADRLVVVSSDHGGYKGGDCVICGATGWLGFERKGYDGRYGFPHYADSRNGGPVTICALFHRPKCPVGSVLDEYGKFKGEGGT